MLAAFKKKLPSKAFALVELLVAVSIFAMVISVVYSTFYIGIKAYRMVQDELLLRRDADRLLEKLALELRNCYGSEYDSGSDKGGFIAWDRGLSFATIIDSYSTGERENLLARITYDFRDGAIFKIVQKGKDFFSGSGGPEEELISGVKEFNIDYIYYRDEEKDGFDWKNVWVNKEMIPKGLRVKIVKTSQALNRDVVFRRFIFIEQGRVGEPVI